MHLAPSSVPIHALLLFRPGRKPLLGPAEVVFTGSAARCCLPPRGRCQPRKKLATLPTMHAVAQIRCTLTFLCLASRMPCTPSSKASSRSAEAAAEQRASALPQLPLQPALAGVPC